MKKILVVSSFPAPYRVAVFEGLAAYYQLDVFFEFDKDQNRNADWFVKGRDFYVLSSGEAADRFADCLHKMAAYDLVLAYDYLNPNARRAMRRAMRAGVPYCVNCDGAFIGRHWLKDLLKRYYVSHAAACFSSGRFAREYFLYYGAKAERIYEHRFTSLTEADVETLGELSDERQRAPEAGSSRLQVLTIGQFIHRKGFDVLLKAWKSLDAQAQLTIVGGGDLRGEYLETIRENGFKNVEVLDFMKKEDLYRYYQKADLFVLPTREDIWGLVINEAMACGLPVVSTDRCIAAMELLGDGAGGLIVPVGDSEALAAAIGRLLGDDELRQRMGERNRREMREQTLERIVESHREVIEKIL